MRAARVFVDEEGIPIADQREHVSYLPHLVRVGDLEFVALHLDLDLDGIQPLVRISDLVNCLVFRK
ncbi:hypothetical protein [Xanthomonas sp. NCPPB 2632]|jgi:hypothetical protein|uniref:hypothetical protein n=1 Tax=Xanthomonas sp. NCPPB 2632 TaxID=3240912 RepID=UPI003517C99A